MSECLIPAVAPDFEVWWGLVDFPGAVVGNLDGFDDTFGVEWPDEEGPYFGITDDWSLAVKVDPPTGTAASDMQINFYLYNYEHIGWDYVEFFYETYTGELWSQYNASGIIHGIPGTVFIDLADACWWRWRISGGSLYWEYGLDGSIWNSLGSIAWPYGGSECGINLDVFGNVQGPVWTEPHQGSLRWEYLAVDGVVIFDCSRGPAVIPVGQFWPSPKGARTKFGYRRIATYVQPDEPVGAEVGSVWFEEEV